MECSECVVMTVGQISVEKRNIGLPMTMYENGSQRERTGHLEWISVIVSCVYWGMGAYSLLSDVMYR